MKLVKVKGQIINNFNILKLGGLLYFKGNRKILNKAMTRSGLCSRKSILAAL